MYDPILTPQDFANRVRLNTPNPAQEDHQLEFKYKCHCDEPDAAKRSEEQREVARDITQFSNTEGGTVLYGVNEKKDPLTAVTTADGLVPMPDITKATKWIADAIARFIYPASPQPKLTTIDLGSQRVIAVNVAPGIELQGVWDQKTPTAGMEFLYRNNAQKEQMTMEQVAIRMAGTPNRSKRLRLAELASRTTRVRILCPTYNGPRGKFDPILKPVPSPPNAAWVMEISEQDQFTLIFTSPPPNQALQRAAVPYEYLEAAWWDHAGGIVVLQLSAMVAPGVVNPVWR